MRYQATFMCLKRGHFFYPTLPHQQGPNFSFAARGSRTSLHQGAGGARGSRTSKHQGCRWWPRLPHIRAPRCQWCSRLPDIRAIKVPMVFEAPTHPSRQGAGGSCCKRGGTGRIHSLLAIRILPSDWGGTGRIHSLLGTELVMIFEFYLWYWGGTRIFRDASPGWIVGAPPGT